MSGIQDDDAGYGNDQQAVADLLNEGTGVQGAITVTTSASEAKVGGSRLANRKTLTVHNNGGNTIYWGYDNTVTSSTGTPIFKDQFVSFSVGDGQAIFLVTASSTSNVRITEGA